MRYWHPFTAQTVAEVKAYAPDEILLLPLYPQFSSTTTGSSITAWDKEATKQRLNTPTRKICCYPLSETFIRAHTEAIRPYLSPGVRLLFSAHGLPEKVIAKGDPYQWQIEQTAHAVVEALGVDGLDWQISYQSRVGPMAWIKPATDMEIKRAGVEGKALVVVPIAFVSEHSETLVELDIEYKHLADASGVSDYTRVPALSVNEIFLQSLAEICAAPLQESCAPAGGMRLCPKDFTACPCQVF